jgi:TP901 family phage tail tape measure protein
VAEFNMVTFNRGLYFTAANLLAIDHRVQSLTKPFDILQKAVTGTAVAMVGLGTATAFFTSKVAAKFETGIKEIGTLVAGLADDSIPNLTENILQLGTEVPKTINDLAEAFYFVQSAMPGNIENFEILEVAAKGATLGLTDTLTVADALTTMMNSFGKATEEEAVDSLNKMFGAVIEGKITMETLAENIGTVAAAAANAGLAMEELLGAYALATRITGQASRSATGLRAALLALAKPSVQAQLAFKEYGIAIRDVDGGIRNLIDILREVKEAQLSYNEIAQLFPRARTINTIVALISHFDELERAIAVVASSANITEEAFTEMMSTFENKMDIAKNLIDILSQSIGAELNEQLKLVVSSFNSLIKEIIDWNKASGTSAKLIKSVLGDAIDSVIGSLQNLASNFDEILDKVNFQFLIDQFESLKESLAILFDVDITSTEGLISIIQTLSNSLGFLFATISSFTRSIDVMVEGVTGLFELFGSIATTTTEAAIVGMEGFAEAVGFLAGEMETGEEATRSWLDAIDEWLESMGFGKEVLAEFVGTMAALAVPISVVTAAISGIITVVATLLSIAYLPELATMIGVTLPTSFVALAVNVENLILLFSSLVPVLILVASIIASFAIVRAVQDMKELTKGWKAWTRETRNAIIQSEILQKMIDKTNAKFGTQAKTLDEAREIHERVREATKKLAEELGVTTEEVKKLIKESREYQERMKDAAHGVEEFIEVQTELDQTIALVNGAMDEAEKTLKNLESLYEGLSSGLSKIDAEKAAKSVEKLTEQLLKLGVSQASIELVDFSATIKGVDSVKSKFSEISKAVELGIISIKKARSMNEAFVQELVDRYGIAKEVVASFTRENFFLMESMNRTRNATNLMGEALMGLDRIEDLEGSIRKAITQFSRLGGVTSGQAAQAIVGYAKEVRELARQFGMTETAAKSLKELALGLAPAFVTLGSEVTLDYAKALRDLDSELTRVESSLDSNSLTYKAAKKDLEGAKNAVRDLKAQFAAGDLSSDEFQKALGHLNAELSDLQASAGALEDEEGNAITQSEKWKAALIVLGQAMTDVNLFGEQLKEAIGKYADEEEKAEDAGDKLKDTTKKQITIFDKLTGQLTTVNTELVTLKTNVGELDKVLDKGRSFDVATDIAMGNLREVQNLLDSIQDKTVRVTVEEKHVQV